MAEDNYADLAVFRQLFDSINSDPPGQRDLSYNGLATSLLAYYFPPTEGFTITPCRINATSFVLRVQYYLPRPGQNERPVRIPIHLLASVTHPSRDWNPTMEVLDDISQSWKDLEYTWTMAFHGLDVYFFWLRPQVVEDLRFLGLEERFEQGGLPLYQNRYHLLEDSVKVHQHLTTMSLETCWGNAIRLTESEHTENGDTENGHTENGHTRNGHTKNGDLRGSPDWVKVEEA
ncbi:uncharacterized protein DSM5745_06659 [Aspergillus mulundensis]|uniref:Uncharacterized protein n=1 Tax=Aspergillus mulundensis TaxID=1810919 RepID=A0A3D8RRE7_9EURO|nr:hypothetical protein DSM5745_06659 [Aspergillus mulundensis]RDW76667.1 hypothetical protein DSM5745_06659 [Aspergillus mulundensis]